MAKEWYLLKSPYTQLGGDEGEIFVDFAEDSFSEVLASELAYSVELYNYDLSECTIIRAIIQNRVQDTKLQSLSRHLMVLPGTCKSGMYVKYKGKFWLITGLVDDNGMYEKAVMTLCNRKLSWRNKNGKIIQRWVNISSASQYNNGQTGNKTYILRTDQLSVAMPNDEECLLLDQGQRFIIDKRCDIYEKYFDKDTKKNIANDVITYEVTRINNFIYDYTDSGYCEVLVTQDEQHVEDGYYVIDGIGYWLCDSPVSNNDKDKESTLRCKIICENNCIYVGLYPGEFIAKFYDDNGNILQVLPKWEVECSFKDKLEITYENNSIFIFVDDFELINKTFDLILSGEGYESDKITVKIAGLY